ncbi:unnamed protein product [Mycena citricolor]|uniref:Uncharacterized protein n=1 Tax=Mycena citricolor TaxID=2018698 RepID=A0AAD2H7M0_9AGAR|nr:unnamed protein product [Mycena citricolor]CAK5269630.1 unnamed protein product [Mycena citricolor]
MASALTFTHKQCQDCKIIDSAGSVIYTLRTTKDFFLRGRRVTSIEGGGLLGRIDWRAGEFDVGGTILKWSDAGGTRSAPEWRWSGSLYRLEWQNGRRELLATLTSDNVPAFTMLFTPYQPHLFGKNEKPTIRFLDAVQDEKLKLFLLLAALQMEMTRQDAARDRQNAAIDGSGGAAV